MISSDSIPVPVNGLCVRELGDTIIIITESGDELHSLDEAGGFIWRLIDGKTTVMHIIEKMCQEYDVDRSRAEHDLTNFLSSLKEKNLITI
jgi:hypothetical protein